MRFASTSLIPLLALGALSNPLPHNNQDDDNSPENRQGNSSGGGQPTICPNLNTMDSGCIRYTRGFDVTGVVTEVDITFPKVRSVCDCIQECLNRPSTCANFVWKFSSPDDFKSGHRSCTLYSDFNLPSGVTVVFDLNNPNNSNINAAEITAHGNNPHAGALVPQAFKDPNGVVPDNDAVSGPVWTLANGQVQC